MEFIARNVFSYCRFLTHLQMMRLCMKENSDMDDYPILLYMGITCTVFPSHKVVGFLKNRASYANSLNGRYSNILNSVVNNNLKKSDVNPSRDAVNQKNIFVMTS